MNKSTGKRVSGLGVALACGLLALAGTAFAQGERAASLQAYALRGSQDTSAKLYLSVFTATGSTPPQQLQSVTVSSIGANGHPAQLGTYTDVDASTGQAVIDLGDVPLGTALAVHVRLGEEEALNATTAVTEFAIKPQSVVVSDFEGFGAQMNMHLYTALSNPAKGWNNEPPQDLSNVEQKVKDMKPGLSRIFLSPANYDPANQNRMDSFYKTVELAQAAGAKVNITWWFLEHSTNAATQETLLQTDMQEFADTLVDLVVNHHLTAVQQITIQNEPNTTWLNKQKDTYKEAYTLLDEYLRNAGIRNRIKFVGGDLVYNNQLAWFQYMAENMGELLDGWSVHIYWNYYQTWYMQDRLKTIMSIYSSIPANERKPLSVTEYGVRGYKTVNGVRVRIPDPYKNGTLILDPVGMYIEPDGSTVPVNTTNDAAFEQAWFNMQAADDGFVGFSKWDFYHAQYDFGYQDHSLIGYLFNPQPGQDRWPLRPAYYMEWLMANTTGQHWQVLGLDGTSGSKLVTPFRSPNGDLTVFAMNTDASAASSITVGDLPRGTEFNVLAWNANGKGQVSDLGTVNAGGTGSLTVNAPAGSMIALTTVRSVGWNLCRSKNGPCVTAVPGNAK